MRLGCGNPRRLHDTTENLLLCLHSFSHQSVLYMYNFIFLSPRYWKCAKLPSARYDGNPASWSALVPMSKRTLYLEFHDFSPCDWKVRDIAVCTIRRSTCFVIYPASWSTLVLLPKRILYIISWLLLDVETPSARFDPVYFIKSCYQLTLENPR